MENSNDSEVSKWQTVTDLSQLKRGSIVRHVSNTGNHGKAYVVDANYGTHATAVTTIDITNPTEWEVLK